MRLNGFARTAMLQAAGKSLGDAQAMAEEALTLHVDGLVEDGVALPEPSTRATLIPIVEMLTRINPSRIIAPSLTDYVKYHI